MLYKDSIGILFPYALRITTLPTLPPKTPKPGARCLAHLNLLALRWWPDVWMGLYRDNGKENGNYYFGLKVQGLRDLELGLSNHESSHTRGVLYCRDYIFVRDDIILRRIQGEYRFRKLPTTNRTFASIVAGPDLKFRPLQDNWAPLLDSASCFAFSTFLNEVPLRPS